MRFTDIFLRRPVLSIVVSFIILLLGIRSLDSMQVRQYPELSNTVIEVTTVYPGADARLMQGFIGDPIQAALARVDGVDYITSSSSAGSSLVTAYIRLNHDPNAAMTEAMAQVSAARSELPSEAEEPVVKKKAGSGVSSLYMAFSSTVLNRAQITDYVSRVVRPQLSIIPGVASVTLLGAQKISVRIWLNPQLMALNQLTAEQVYDVLKRNNLQVAAGSLRGYTDSMTIRAETSVSDVNAVENLVIKTTDSGVVRLADLAKVTIGPEQSDVTVLSNGQKALFVSIDATPDANPLTVVRDVRAALPRIRENLPASIHLDVNYDSTIFIQESIREVLKTLVEAVIIVICVIFVFMGSPRSVVIPIVTIPLSLIGVCTLMLAMDFSINLMTLLAFVLAIGLVVDDAIVVVENVHRHIEEGKSPFHAAIVGAREIAVPVISMTITLAAVYAPMAFLGGLTGALFKEFALTLAGSVLVSGVIALTLSPMMCAHLLKAHDGSRIAQVVDAWFSRLSARYEHLLSESIRHWRYVLIVATVVLLSLPFLFKLASSELAPPEDQGIALVELTGPTDANPEYMDVYAEQVGEIFDSVREKDTYFFIVGAEAVSDGFAGVILKPWGERQRSEKQVVEEVGRNLKQVVGLRGSAFSLPPLPGFGGMPVQFVISTTADYNALMGVLQEFGDAARKSGYFIFQKFDLQYDRPEVKVTVDRDRAGLYGVSMQDIGMALGGVYGGNYVNRIDIEGKAYKVLPKSERQFRLDPAAIGTVYVRGASGQLIPLSSLVRTEIVTEPNVLRQFNQLNSATFQAVPMPGAAMGDIVSFLRDTAQRLLPSGYTFDYAGPTRQFVTEGSALMLTFAFALVIIYLVLAAQYESFRDPLVIMVTVPLAMVGAMAPLAIGLVSLNIYTQVGLITLIGLITKHGILICEVAREEQIYGGKDRREAVAHAASLRLRPILMTTAAMVAGAFPLTLASGAGAGSRHSIGVVIVSGLLIGTLFTLFVLPVVYSFLGDDHREKHKYASERDRSAGLEPAVPGNDL